MHPIATSPASNTTRRLALSFAMFVALATAAIWYLIQSFGPDYFFAVHFTLALGLPFLVYGIGGRAPWFGIGLGLTAATMAFLSWWSAQAQGFDWTHAFASAVGLFFAWVVHVMYTRARRPHGPTPRYG